MLVAEEIYAIAKALSKEELGKLHALIGKDLNVCVPTKKTTKKVPIISNEEAKRLLLKSVFKVNL